MDVVAAIRSALTERLGAAVCELWFDSGVRLDYDGQRLLVTAPSSFLRDRFRRRAHSELARIVSGLLGADTLVDYRVAVTSAGSAAGGHISGSATDAPSDPLAPAEIPGAVAPEVLPLHPTAGDARCATQAGRADFESEPGAVPTRPLPPEQIVVGESNRFAMTSMQMIIRDPGRWSPLFLYGPAGSGKTLLLQGLLANVRQRRKLRAVMLSGEQFTVDFLEALRGAGLPSFRRRYRDVQFLLLDDVQFLIGKTATRNELLHTLEALQRHGCQTVITADRAPAELTELGQELVSRFSAGLLTVVEHPDRAMRADMLRRMAPPGLLADDTVELLAAKISGDARLLQGAVNRLLVLSYVLKRSPRREEAEAELGDFFRSTQRRVRLPDILEAAGSVLGVEISDIQSAQRSPTAAHPRMLVMFLARKHTQAPLKEISEFFSKRSHSTVISACGEVQRWLQENRTLPLAGGGCLPVSDAIRRIEARLHRA